MAIRLVCARLLSLGIAAALLDDCSGSRSATVLPGLTDVPPGAAAPPPVAASAGKGTLQFRFTVPVRSRRSRDIEQARTVQFVSPGTRSVTVVVTPAGGPPGPPELLSCSSGACGGSVFAPVGHDTVTVDLYDQAAGAGHLLSTGSSTVYVSADTSNAVSLKLEGVVSSIATSLPGVTTFMAAASPAMVTALDASGAAISGTYANPISVAVSDAAAAVTAGAAQLNSSTDTLAINYNGNRDPAGATVTFSAAGATPSAPTLIPVNLTQSFTGSSVTSWSGGTGGIACLTAGDGTGSLPACASGDPGGTSGTLPDSAGNGALRLQKNTLSTSSFAMYTAPFLTRFGLVIQFDLHTYAPNPCAADGAALVISDGGAAVATTPGFYNGSLGYAGFGSGISGGYLGIGFDAFGGFSDPGNGGPGGPGRTAESLAIRGATAAVPSTNYLTGYQIAGVPSSLPFNWDSGAVTRLATDKRTIRFTLTSSAQLKVEVDSGGGFVTYIPLTAISAFPTQPALPATVRIGFSSGSGGCGLIQEIQNLSVS